MGNLSENLIKLQTAKESIKTAIESKGQDLTNVPFTEYASKIEGISVAGGVKKTTGTFTIGQSYYLPQITHGLPKPPKLVYCRHKDFPNAKLYCCGFVYTEQLSTIYHLASSEEIVASSIQLSIPNFFAPPHGNITVDNTNIIVGQTSRQWHSGDYEWEAYTW